MIQWKQEIIHRLRAILTKLLRPLTDVLIKHRTIARRRHDRTLLVNLRRKCQFLLRIGRHTIFNEVIIERRLQHEIRYKLRLCR